MHTIRALGANHLGASAIALFQYFGASAIALFRSADAFFCRRRPPTTTNAHHLSQSAFLPLQPEKSHCTVVPFDFHTIGQGVAAFWLAGPNKYKYKCSYKYRCKYKYNSKYKYELVKGHLIAGFLFALYIFSSFVSSRNCRPI